MASNRQLFWTRLSVKLGKPIKRIIMLIVSTMPWSFVVVLVNLSFLFLKLHNLSKGVLFLFMVTKYAFHFRYVSF